MQKVSSAYIRFYVEPTGRCLESDNIAIDNLVCDALQCYISWGEDAQQHETASASFGDV